MRKCFVHPDWRLGSRLKVHGFTMQACPLSGVAGCRQAWPGLRYICLQLCGEWGRETAPVNSSCAGFDNAGMMLRGMELAHFRVAPEENQKHGFTSATWLARLAAPVRQGLSELRKPRVRLHGERPCEPKLVNHSTSLALALEHGDALRSDCHEHTRTQSVEL